MLRSMTGFGKGIAENLHATVKIEIKSLNYKFFEVISRLPSNLAAFEDKIREILQKKISRGRLNLFLTYDKKGKKDEEVFIDKKVGKQYYTRILELKRSLGLNGKIGIEQLVSLPGVVAYKPHEEDAKKMWPLINKALNMAIDDLVQSKAREGKMLKKNIVAIVKSIEASLKKIKVRTPLVVKDYKKRLLKNVKALTGSKRIFNPERIEEEAAIFARNCDITEEIHRVAAHISGFKKILANHGETGRRLDFIAQEMHREVNTIGAKANDFPISKEVIKVKSLIEKIREQVRMSNKKNSSNLINLGFNNIVVKDKIVAVVSPEAAPIKRLKDEARQNKKLIDATSGRRTRAVIITDSDHVILASVQPETIAQRFQ